MNLAKASASTNEPEFGSQGGLSCSHPYYYPAKSCFFGKKLGSPRA